MLSPELIFKSFLKLLHFALMLQFRIFLLCSPNRLIEDRRVGLAWQGFVRFLGVVHDGFSVILIVGLVDLFTWTNALLAREGQVPVGFGHPSALEMEKALAFLAENHLAIRVAVLFAKNTLVPGEVMSAGCAHLN